MRAPWWCLCGLWALDSAAAELSINGQTLQVDEQTVLLLDEQPVSAAQLPYLRGMRAEAEVRTGLRGVLPPIAAVLRFDFGALGPVTSVSPLRVMGQEVTVTSDTVLLNIASPAALSNGQIIAVSGHVDVNGSLVATSLIREPLPPAVWRLTGYVAATGPGASELRIGTQNLSFAGVTPQQCTAGPAVGDYVELRATAIAGFSGSSVLDTVTQLRCATAVPLGTIGAAGALEGLISSVPDASNFVLGGLTISHDNTTQFQFGSLDELAAGVRVELEGSFTAANVFAASVIALVRPVARFQGSVAALDVQAGQQIRILGQTVRRSAQLRDEDSIQANGLTSSRQVEVRGYADTRGVLWSTRIRDRGNPNANSSRARGAAHSILPPTFGLFGLTVNTTGSSFLDIEGLPLTQPQFFAQLTAGMVLDVSGASWQSASTTLSGGVIAMIAPDVPPARAAGAVPDLLVGITDSAGFGPVVFVDRFE